MISESIKIVDNMKIDHANNCVIVSVNTKIYPMPIIYSASYIMIDKAFVILGGDIEKEIFVTLRPKKSQNLEELGMDFNTELINYGFYTIQSEITKNIRNAIVQRAMFANSQEASVCGCKEDIKEIAKPWSEQKGKMEK